MRDAADQFFDLDGRFLRSLRLLVRRPGALSVAWSEGRQASYTGPVRLYLITSLVYFLAVAWTESRSVLFVTFGPGDEQLASAFQNMMLVMVPVFAWILRRTFRKTGRMYVEHLVFALYLHAVWYVLGLIYVLPQRWGLGLLESGSWLVYPVAAVQVVAQVGTLVYAFLALRRFHELGRLETALRLAATMLLYIVALVPVVMGYIVVMRLLAGEPVLGG